MKTETIYHHYDWAKRNLSPSFEWQFQNFLKNKVKVLKFEFYKTKIPIFKNLDVPTVKKKTYSNTQVWAILKNLSKTMWVVKKQAHIFNTYINLI